MRKLVSEPASRVQTLQRISKTARQCLALPANDGIIWKQSSQYSGLMSIYLQGGCSSLPLYLSKHIWCPGAGASNRNVSFPLDACSLFLQFCALVVWLSGIWQSIPPPLRMGGGDLTSGQGVVDFSCVLVPVTKTRTIREPHKKHLNPHQSIAATLSVLQTARTSVECTWATTEVCSCPDI